MAEGRREREIRVAEGQRESERRVAEDQRERERERKGVGQEIR